MDRSHAIYNSLLEEIRDAFAVSPYLVGRVLSRIFLAGRPVPRIDIANGTMLPWPYSLSEGSKLSAGSVSNVTDALLDDRIGLLTEPDSPESNERPSGCPIKPLSLGGDRWGLIGIHVTHVREHVSALTGILTGLNGHVIVKPEELEVTDDMNSDPMIALAQRVADLCEQLFLNWPDRRKEQRILGIGVALGGHIYRGQVMFSTLADWNPDTKGFNLALEISQYLALSQSPAPAVLVDNNTNTFAIQALHRAHLAAADVSLVQVYPEGVGGALVINGWLYRGGRGMAPEPGHLTTIYEEFTSPSSSYHDETSGKSLLGFTDPCTCGEKYNHVNTRATPRRILEEIQKRVPKPDSEEDQHYPELDTIEKLDTALKKAATKPGYKIGPTATDTMLTTHAQVFQEAGDALGRGLAQLVNVVNPSQLVLQLPSALARPEPQKSGAQYLAAVEAALTEYCFSTGAVDARGDKERLKIESIDFADIRTNGAQAAAVAALYNFIEHAQGHDGCPQPRSRRITSAKGPA